MRNLLMAAVAVSALAFAAAPASAAVTFYSNEASFLSAAGTVATEDFADTSLITGLSFVSTVGSIGSGRFNDRVVTGGANTTFHLGGPKNAFGGTFDLTPGGFGQGLNFTISLLNNSGTLLSSTLYNANPGTFFGFVSTTAFDKVLIKADASRCCAETYNVDNLHVGTAVPEPAAWALMISGFGLAGAALRRRRTAFA